MSVSYLNSLDLIAVPDPEKLPKGLDAINHSIHGKFSRVKANKKLLLEQAILAGELSETMAALSDGALRSELAKARRSFRLAHKVVSDKIMVRALALLREAGKRAWRLRAYDVQLAGVLGLYRGYLIEMATGEGKTIVAAMAGALAAWSGKPCHVVTVNDYLARRDADQFSRLAEWAGISVASVTSKMAPHERKSAYKADVVYTTSKEFLADFLRDRIALGTASDADRLVLRNLAGDTRGINQVVQRGLHTAIIDEADSVLIDEAVTPLIISREEPNESLRQACIEAYHLAEQLEAIRHYHLDTRHKRIDLTSRGETMLASLCDPLPPLWRGADRRRELVEQALQAKHFFFREKQYIVQDEKVVIVDEFSGRLMPQRTWREGLHQAIEVRENLAVSSPSETIARMSFQRFFRSFSRLSGMSGTAHEAAGELWQIYRLPVVTIPTNRPVIRKQEKERHFLETKDKWSAIIDEIKTVHETGRPILVGTRSIEASERLSSRFLESGFDVRLLNARRHEEEALIIANAGERGAITIATNMAGRGTDIRLAKGVADLGGLHVVATERHEAGRIDRQLFGRAGRQGDQGSARAFVSFEDELFARFLPSPVRYIMKWVSRFLPIVAVFFMGSLANWAQKIAQRRAYRQRRQVLQSDQWLEESLGFTGSDRT